MRHGPAVEHDGSIRGPDGRLFRCTDRKLKRRECEALIRDGAPILTDVYPDGLEWWDAVDARDRWTQIAPLLVSRWTASIHEGWVAHLCESEEGAPLIRLDGWH